MPPEKTTPAGVPGAGLPARAATANAPGTPTQIPVLFVESIPAPVRAAENATTPDEFTHGNSHPFEKAAVVPGATLPSLATS
ncbi:MAG: hypothetical protein AMXMBFR20_30980 [Planctomycetia bacterium]